MHAISWPLPPSICRTMVLIAACQAETYVFTHNGMCRASLYISLFGTAAVRGGLLLGHAAYCLLARLMVSLMQNIWLTSSMYDVSTTLLNLLPVRISLWRWVLQGHLQFSVIFFFEGCLLNLADHSTWQACTGQQKLLWLYEAKAPGQSHFVGWSTSSGTVI